jgi:N utilization substance protein B
MARSTARKRALNTLYEADEKGQDFLSLLAERIAQPGAQTPLPDYAIEIVRGVADNRATIDRALDEHSTGWKIRRMAVVDRNILRIAAWEILRNDEVPDKVAIDEALSLARMLSDEDSLSFIHGLLSALCADKGQYPVQGKADHDDAQGEEIHSDHGEALGAACDSGNDDQAEMPAAGQSAEPADGAESVTRIVEAAEHAASAGHYEPLAHRSGQPEPGQAEDANCEPGPAASGRVPSEAPPAASAQTGPTAE